MEKSKIENLNPQEYTHLPHAEQKFEDHEQTDVAIRPLVWTLVAIALLIAVSAVGMWGLFQVYWKFSQDAPDNQKNSNVQTTVRISPEGFPELQGVPPTKLNPNASNPNSPGRDMAEMRERNTLILAGQAPMRDGQSPAMQAGMPIEQAMTEALSRKIFKTAPATQQTGQPPAQPATQPATPASSAAERN